MFHFKGLLKDSQRVKRPFLIKKNLDSLEINALTDNQSEMFIKSIHFDIISSVLKNGLYII